MAATSNVTSFLRKEANLSDEPIQQATVGGFAGQDGGKLPVGLPFQLTGVAYSLLGERERASVEFTTDRRITLNLARFTRPMVDTDKGEEVYHQGSFINALRQFVLDNFDKQGNDADAAFKAFIEEHKDTLILIKGAKPFNSKNYEGTPCIRTLYTLEFVERPE